MANAVAEGAKGAGAEVDMFGPRDFDASKAGAYTGLAFGCPAMGAEVLEEEEYQPMWDAVKGSLGGKKVGLFGSYGWGDGEWMRTWEDDAKAAGVYLANDSVIANDYPGDDAIEDCKNLGRSIC